MMCTIRSSGTQRFIGSLALAFSLFHAGAADAATLKRESRIDAEHVVLGDLFDGAGAAAEVRVSGAPRPGEATVFNAYQLSDLAKKHGVDWEPRSKYDRATVRRAGQLVTGQSIIEALTFALEAESFGEELEVQINGRMPEIYVATGENPEVSVTDLSYDRQQRRFSARLLTDSNDSRARPVPISGRVYALVSLPVLNHRMMPGERIGAGDIDWMKVRANRVSATTITSPSELEGMTPRRLISPYAALRLHEVKRYTVVEKGDRVTITYDTSIMRLTAVGKALESGGRGDTITVINTKSNRPLEATVTDPGKVTVVPPGGGQLALRQ